MAITDKEKGVWGLDQVYNKINQGSIWDYDGVSALFAWGINPAGNNTNIRNSSPVQVPGTTWDANIGTQSNYASLIVKTNGTLWGWGGNQSGILGQNQNENDSNNIYSSPIQIPGTTWKQVSGGVRAAWAVKTDGTLWTWGSNDKGKLAQNNNEGAYEGYSSPVQIPGTTWQYLSQSGQKTDSRHAFATKTDGTLWTWGLNQQGECGHNTSAPDTWTGISSPKQLPGTTWATVTGNFFSATAIKTDGTLWAWGNNDAGQLGQNNKTKRSSPPQIPGSTWSFVEGGSCAIGTKTDGTLWMWGQNEIGALGQNNRTDYSSPTQIPGTTWKITAWGASTRGGEYTSSDQSSAAIKTDGTLWAWGHNTYGQLGVNNTTSYSSPTQVLGGDYLNVQISAASRKAQAMLVQ